jgi:hypothetical protein
MLALKLGKPALQSESAGHGNAELSSL